MSNTWMYDGFPLKRADGDTRGDDYQYVIQSLDASLRHLFGIPVGVSMTPAFSISENGNVEILQRFSIGTTIQINEIVDEIEIVGSTIDDERLANVTAIRNFTSQFITDYLTIQDVFVLKAGDTMTGLLLAEGGVSAAVDLNIENALFVNSPRLPDRIPLVSSGRSLIQWDDGVLVGSSAGELKLTGAGSRPSYKNEAIAFVSDIVAAVGGTGIDYVPEAGGTFTGLVNFDAGLLFPTGVGLGFEFNAGGSAFAFAYVFDDLTGEVELGSGPGGVRVANDLKIDETVQLFFGGWLSVIEDLGGELKVGNIGVPLDLRGSEIRPTYNSAEIALRSDTVGAYIEGDGLTFTDLGGGLTFEIGITLNGITRNFMPVGVNGQYSRLDPNTGDLIWDSLALVEGTGVEIVENPITFQQTIGIADLGVDTLQIADDAVNNDKIAPAAVAYFEIDADDTAVVPATDFTLVMRDEVLQWRKGGAILATVQNLSFSISEDYNGGGSYPWTTRLNVTNGPYVLHGAWLTQIQDVLYNDMSIEVIIDGVSIGTFNASLGELAPPRSGWEPFINGPMFAKRSLEIKTRPGNTSSKYTIAYFAVTRLN